MSLSQSSTPPTAPNHSSTNSAFWTKGLFHLAHSSVVPAVANRMIRPPIVGVLAFSLVSSLRAAW